MSWQGVYQPRDIQVVVRQHKLTSESSFDVGYELKPGDLPVYHMRSLFRRKIIGKKDSPWVNEMLERATTVKTTSKKEEGKAENKDEDKVKTKANKVKEQKPKIPVGKTKKDRGIG